MSIRAIFAVGSKTPTLYAVTAEVTEFNNRNMSKRKRVFPARTQS